MHISQSANEGHYVSYSNYNGIWAEFNDDKITTYVDIYKIKNKAYYYCYRRVIKDYVAYIKILAQANVEKKCAYCHDIIVGLATHHIPSTGKINIAGAMVDHLRLCNVLVSSKERISIAL